MQSPGGVSCQAFTELLDKMSGADALIRGPVHDTRLNSLFVGHELDELHVAPCIMRIDVQVLTSILLYNHSGSLTPVLYS